MQDKCPAGGADRAGTPLAWRIDTFAKEELMKSMLILTAVLLASATASTAWGDAGADYTKMCANCHGKDGKGQTKMGEKFKVKDLSDPKVQAEFTDEQAMKDISDGLKDEKTGKVTMPARKDKLSPDQIKDLVKYVRGFKGS